MRLDQNGMKDRAAWEKAGYCLPQYDREKVSEATRENPFWIHFGAGNIFRAFQANVVQKLLNAGKLDRGLIVAEGYDYEIIGKMNRPHDDYSILVTLKANGSVEKTVIGSVVESLAPVSYTHLNRIQRIRHISIPHLMPLVCIFTILAVGGLFSGSFDLFYIIPRDIGMLYETTDILPTYIYRALKNGTYATGAAVNLLQSVAGLVLVVVTNLAVKKISPENSMF